MKDIGELLRTTMNKEQCSSLTAFLRLNEEKENGIHILQSEPTEQTGRRLCDKGNSKNYR